MPTDFLFRADLEELDPFMADLIRWEQERQARKLILIPSESYAPKAVRQALGSVFQNVYAEGYPPLRMTRDPEERLRDVAWQLAFYRRYADRRFYKGVDYVHLVECLAQRRCAELFAHDSVRPEHIFVNVQPLSGAAANLAIYQALMKPGDVLMGMDLFQGGHLTHGSEFNVSGKWYRRVSYGVDPKTERLDYDAIRELARQHRPRVIVAGYTSYPWAPDWHAFRSIADEVGAYLVADIAHTAGMAAAGAYPNPVGIAHVTVFTTHKTICGPRGACILTTDEALAQAIDMAIFPGEQGGPHVNKFAAMAVAFGLARTEEFRRLQHQIVANARALADALQKRGLRLAYGGTNTHLLLVDLKSIPTRTGYPVWGEPAARILDLAGVVVNKNTIPGDTVTALATGIRMGTPWVTQRGLTEEDMDTLADLIARLLFAIQPFAYNGLVGTLPRGKVDLDVLEEVRAGVAKLAEKAGIDFEYTPSGYPHFYSFGPEENPTALRVTGWRARQFVQQVVTANIADLEPGQSRGARMLDRHGGLIADVVVQRETPDEWGRDRYLITPTANGHRVAAWLRALSDGYVLFDETDVYRKVEGPVVVEEVPHPSPGGFAATPSPLPLGGRGEGAGGWGEGSPHPSPAASGATPSPLLTEGQERGGGWGWGEGSPHPSPAASGGTPSPLPLGGRGEGAGGWGEGSPHPSPAASGATPSPLPLGGRGEGAGGWGEGSPHPSPAAFAATPSPLPLGGRGEGAGGWGEGSPHPSPAASGGTPSPLLTEGQERGGDRGWGEVDLTKPYFIGQAHLPRPDAPSPKEEWKWEERESPLKRTPLYETHKRMGAKMVPFAGWEMPVWYTSVSEEHRAVRETAGLFDVAHMGVFEVAGPHATAFLDTVCSNYVAWLEDGQSLYGYLLDPDANVIDDIMVYRRRADLYLVVVNAANEEKDWDWLNAVNGRRVVIDRARPWVQVEAPAILRNLKDPASGERQKRDIALQGPASLPTLLALADGAEFRTALSRLRRTDLLEGSLAGIPVVIARTGYTGEGVGLRDFRPPRPGPPRCGTASWRPGSASASNRRAWARGTPPAPRRGSPSTATNWPGPSTSRP
jgi:glycine/serine hydroxymethyltransferase/glycine cleavage system aminomethyltransferase T